jgi:hypothetical protein
VPSIRHGGEFPVGGDVAPAGTAGSSQWVRQGQHGQFVRRPDQLRGFKAPKSPKSPKERRRRAKS